MPARQIAGAIFSHAGVTDMYREGMGYLAIRLLGEHSLQYGLDGQKQHALLVRRPWRILVRPHLDDRRMTLAVATVIAEWWMETQPPASDHPDLDQIALELAVPEASLRDAIKRLGYGLEALADDFVCPTWAIEERLRSLGGPRKRSGARWRLGVAS